MSTVVLMALRAVEWLPAEKSPESERRCPICNGPQLHPANPGGGHRPGCLLDAALSEVDINDEEAEAWRLAQIAGPLLALGRTDKDPHYTSSDALSDAADILERARRYAKSEPG